ncbi:MAG: 3'-5' exonuclease [Prevotellaceae bacterium]|nr:3'-5' exonuclease [Prevotellaceae bacterium]
MAKKTLYEKYDKKLSPSLPKLAFPGRIFVITTEKEAEKAVDFLMKFHLLGIDTETKPSFKKHVMHKVALLQVSTENECFLFRLNRLGISSAILRLLESDILKVGVSLSDDIRMISARTKFHPDNFVDLQKMVELLGIKDKSLAKLYANLFGKKISKSQQLSNWECDILSEAQMQYAAIDAWACINLYKEIKHLINTQDYELIINDEESLSEEG